MIGHHLVLKPVAFLLISERRHEIIVIREIVETVERRNILEALNKHALLAQCIVIQRTVNLVHPVLPGPVLGSLQQKPRNLDVLYGVEPSETAALLVISLVITRIDHRTDASDNLPSISDKPKLVRTVIKCRVFGQAHHLVRVKGRDILFIVLVKLIWELYECFEILPRRYLGYNILRHKPSFSTILAIIAYKFTKSF